MKFKVLVAANAGNLAASGMTPKPLAKQLLFLQTLSPTLCVVALVVIVCLVLYWIERLESNASVLKGERYLLFVVL